jgi:hypothetical protein
MWGKQNMENPVEQDCRHMRRYGLHAFWKYPASE